MGLRPQGRHGTGGRPAAVRPVRLRRLRRHGRPCSKRPSPRCAPAPAGCAAITRQHTPTEAEPLILIVIDELANLTAYLTDRQLKDRIKAALSVLLSQGRAVGVHVAGRLQDPRKEVLPFRDLFPTRIALRLSEDAEVDLVLGDGMRDRGALCDRIPKTCPASATSSSTATRPRCGSGSPTWTDDDIRDLAHTYGRLRLIDGETWRAA